jgi:LmbE family N-acetylglucosaminyl deacetylase
MNTFFSSNSIISRLRNKPAALPFFNQIISAEKIMILAPHPDDEIMGCGGILYKYFKAGTEIHIVYISDGSFGIIDRDIELRKSEACAIKEIVPKVIQHFLDFKDSRLFELIDSLQIKINNFINEVKPNIIFSPWILDHHDDHVAVTAALAQAIKPGIPEMIISLYEIMSPVFGNHSVNITSEFEIKKALLNNYRSQIQRYNIAGISTTLNLFRAELSRRKNIEAIECFLTLESFDFVKILTSLTEGA